VTQVSAKQTIFAAVSYGFLAGGNAVLGLMDLLHHPADLTGCAFLAFAVAFCGLAARHARMLIKDASHQIHSYTQNRNRTNE
jgi:hypothetical protein